MRRLPRPRSRGFRAMLAMALLAWAMLASGALAPSWHLMASVDMGAAMSMTATQAAAARCDGGAPVHRAARYLHAPAMPMGQGDCCHGACHCLIVCNAVLTVPASTFAVPGPSAEVPMIAVAGRSGQPAAPPLRPPIA